MVVYKRASDVKELDQILTLQQQNLPTNLSSDEREKEGFVTVSHSLETLTKMNEVCPHIIAKDLDLVVGYALCMHPNFAGEIEVLKPMFHQIASILPKNSTYIVMGQICVEKSYRRRGVFRRLYRKMQKHVKDKFDSIITEVDSQNRRSLEAHYAIGFENLKIYTIADKEWVIVILR